MTEQNIQKEKNMGQDAMALMREAIRSYRKQIKELNEILELKDAQNQTLRQALQKLQQLIALYEIEGDVKGGDTPKPAEEGGKIH